MDFAVSVLNADYTVINIVSWQSAWKLIHKGKAEIVEVSEKIVRNFDNSYQFVLPKVIKLKKFVKAVYNAKVEFSKTNVHIRDRFTCSYCGCHENLTIDHVIPRSKGGDTSWENCVTSCKPCNWKKGDKYLKDSGFSLKRKPYQPSVVEYFQKKLEHISKSLL